MISLVQQSRCRLDRRTQRIRLQIQLALYRLAGAEVPLYTGTEAASRSVISLASDEAPEELLIATAKTGADGILRFEGILAGVKLYNS